VLEGIDDLSILSSMVNLTGLGFQFSNPALQVGHL